MPRSPDVLVIGGGVIGLAIARRVAQRGGRVTVIERGVPGHEASWAAAGMLAPQCESDTIDPFFDLCRASLGLYPAFAHALRDEAGMEIEYRVDGTLYPALDDREQKTLEQRYQRQREAGLPVVRLTAKEARTIEPNLSNRVQMALSFPDDHQVDNRKLAQALVVAARRAGVDVREGVTITRILTDGDRVIGAVTKTEEWHPDVVVNAAGCWASVLNGLPPGACPPIRPIRGQMLSLDVSASPPFRRVIYSHRSYLVPRADGRLLIGATVEEAGFKKQVTVGGILKLFKGALDLAPSLREYPVESTWSGLRPASPDRLPVLGPAALDGLILATGHYRNGILLAPITGELISDVITTGDIPPMMRPFLPGRFERV
ncbi:MAG: glycine oxidase ThiO [Candidatus Latescibacteria bacterium]|nr:glycine oxidase ThiO [Candidatus Latescibacterota bacterium]